MLENNISPQEEALAHYLSLIGEAVSERDFIHGFTAGAKWARQAEDLRIRDNEAIVEYERQRVARVLEYIILSIKDK